MAIETFTWGIQSASQPTTKSEDTIRKAKFGDGYEQVSGSGLNDEKLIFEYSFRGDLKKGWRSTPFFAATKPNRSSSHRHSEIALWRVQANSLQKVVLGNKLLSVSATFEQAFAP
jgi:phage-related protein